MKEQLNIKNDKMKNYELGQKITVLHKLVREKQDKFRTWKIKMLSEPKEVTVVGIRTIINGNVLYKENGKTQFVRKEHKRALLVAENLKSTFLVYP